jgi:hypothetical protein
MYIQQDATLHSLFDLETALHVSGGTTTHHQERKQLYLQHLVFVTPLLLYALSWKSWNWFACAVGGVLICFCFDVVCFDEQTRQNKNRSVRHPQHTQTISDSSTIAHTAVTA